LLAAQQQQPAADTHAKMAADEENAGARDVRETGAGPDMGGGVGTSPEAAPPQAMSTDEEALASLRDFVAKAYAGDLGQHAPEEPMLVRGGWRGGAAGAEDSNRSDDLRSTIGTTRLRRSQTRAQLPGTTSTGWVRRCLRVRGPRPQA
jgi:hypothetical protein